MTPRNHLFCNRAMKRAIDVIPRKAIDNYVCAPHYPRLWHVLDVG